MTLRGGGTSSLAAAAAISPDKSRCTGPGRGATLVRIALRMVLITAWGDMVALIFVIGLNNLR